MLTMLAAPTSSFADLLRDERSRLGGGDPTRFPQSRMAGLLGVSLRQYQRWEHGESRPTVAGIERIRRALAEHEAREAPAGIVAQVESMQDEIRALRAELAALRARRN